MNRNTLLSLSVEEFIDQISWGIESPAESSPLFNVPETSRFTIDFDDKESHLTLSVRDFFSHCNWQGTPLALGPPLPSSDAVAPTGENAAVAETVHVTPWTASVGIFFKSIPWQGHPQVGLPPVADVPANDDEATTMASFNVDDFTQIF